MATEKSGSDIDAEKDEHEERKYLRELKWKELMSRVDAYRFYIKLILEVNAFYYATTGAVLLFYLNPNSFYPNPNTNDYQELFLLLPILMGTVLGGFLIYARALQKHNSKIINNILTELETSMKIQAIPDLNLLNKLLLVFGILFFTVALSISAVPLLSKTPGQLRVFVVTSCFFLVAGLVSTWMASRKYKRDVEK